MSSFEAGIQLPSRNCVSSWLIMLFCILIFLLFSSLKFLKISRSSFLPCGFRIIYVLILSEQLHRLCFRSMCYEFICMICLNTLKFICFLLIDPQYGFTSEVLFTVEGRLWARTHSCC